MDETPAGGRKEEINCQYDNVLAKRRSNRAGNRNELTHTHAHNAATDDEVDERVNACLNRRSGGAVCVARREKFDCASSSSLLAFAH